MLHRGTHIFSWGRGDLGQLGTDRDQSEAQPLLVRALEDRDVAQVAASVFNSAYVTGTAAYAGTSCYTPMQCGSSLSLFFSLTAAILMTNFTFALCS